jgi:hypothetical protein
MVCSPLSNTVLRLDDDESPDRRFGSSSGPGFGGRIPDLGGLQPDFKAVFGLPDARWHARKNERHMNRRFGRRSAGPS